MKDRAKMTSTVADRYHHHPSPAPSPSPAHPDPHSPSHHDHRRNRKPLGGGVDDPTWHNRSGTPRGADINLLANSLSSRLRKGLGCRTSSSSTTHTTTSHLTAQVTGNGSKSAPPEESSEKRRRSGSMRVPQSILKRTVSREEAEQQSRPSQQDPKSGGHSPQEDPHHHHQHQQQHHLPDVFLTRRWSSSAGNLDRIGVDDDGFNNQVLDRPSPTLAAFVGGGGGGYRSHATNGHVTWVKRSGIFQPADKYAPGRQNLYGDDQPFAHSKPVDYETVTLSSRADSPASDVTSSWSSSKGPRRKGLKVSWKHPGETEGQAGEGDTPRPTESSQSRRQRSAGTAQIDPALYSFVKPKFHPGRSLVPGVGLQWKVPTPTVGRPPENSAPEDGEEEGARTPASGENSGHSSPTSTCSLPATQPPVCPSKPTGHTRDTRHPWRPLHPRDVHPVTTAMEREGTSVSKTKWQVPSLRPVPAYTFIEDLIEAGGRHWHPSMHPARLATRATLDAHSAQNRLKEGVSMSSKATTVSATTAYTSAHQSSQNPQASDHS